MRPSDPVAVSIVIPMRDEAQIVDELLRRLDPIVASITGGCEVIVVDDCSSDSTWQRLRENAAGRPWLRGLRLVRRFGQHPATFAGLVAARAPVIVTMDADLEIAPEDIPSLIGELDKGCDLVFGVRTHTGGGFLRTRVGRAVSILLARFAVGRPPEGLSTFLAAKRRVVEAALKFDVPRPVTPYHLMLGGPEKVSAVRITESQRHAGRSKYGLLRLLRLTADIFFGYTSLPEPALLALVCAVPAGTIAIWLMATVLTVARQEGLSAFLVVIGVLYALAVAMIVLLIVGELALRANDRGRQLYLVGESF